MVLIHIKEDEIGIVYKKVGRPLPPGCLIALNGEVGWQAEILRPGWHTYLPNIEIHKRKRVEIANNEIGIVEAKDGAILSSREKFGKPVECRNFQDAKAFIQKGGQRGIQRSILRNGTYWINTELFYVKKEKYIRIHEGEVGIIEARDGKPLPLGRTFGKVVECNNFQDAQAFIDNGGESGKQLAILTASIYYINTEIVRVERCECVRIEADQVGLVRAKDGKPLPPGRTFGRVVECNNFQDAQAFIDNGGESGKQLAILTAGVYQINTSLFEVLTAPVTTVPQGEIGLIVANDGMPRPENQIFGRVVECNNFTNAQAFIDNKGQQGKQLAILTAGKYQINTDLFTVITSANAAQYNVNPDELKVYTVEKDKIGIVTTLDGKSLPEGEIAGSIIQDHDYFQRPQKFIELGGYKGLQQEFLQEGSWSLNPWFVRVEQVPLTEISADKVGVVISFIGKNVERVSSEDSLVDEGYKGVLKNPLRAGKYAINTRVKAVEIVPTNEIVLEWSDEPKPADNYDASLKVLEVLSKDAFKLKVKVTQIISIAEKDAPKMILRVGSELVNTSINKTKNNAIKNLVIRRLGPMIDNFFRNAAQAYSALDFFDQRTEIRRSAEEHIKEALKAYGVQAINTLINEIDLPDKLAELLNKRKLDEVKGLNYETEKDSEKKRRDLIVQQQENESTKDLIKAQNDAEIAIIVAETAVKTAKAEATSQGLINAVEIDRLKGLSSITIDEFRKRIELLSPELHAQIEIEGKWAEAHANAQNPEIIFGGGGYSNGGDMVQAGVTQMAYLEMLRGLLKHPRKMDLLQPGNNEN